MSIGTLAIDERRQLETIGRHALPLGYQGFVSEEERAAALDWLDNERGITALGFLLRFERHHAEWVGRLSPSDGQRMYEIRSSAECRADRVAMMVEWATPKGSPWNEVVRYPSIHACLVRGPKEYLRKLIGPGSKLLDPPHSPVAALILNTRTEVPEARLEQDFEPAKVRGKVLTTLSGLCGNGRAADSTNPFDTGPFSADPIDPFGPGGYSGGYSGDWKRFTGRGQTVCILDSGVDESHLALRGRVKMHEYFDFIGHHKHAPCAFDRGCHGTKVSGLIAGGAVRLPDLSIPEIDGSFKFGFAPDARLVMLSTLQGECRREAGTVAQIMAGLEAAHKYKDHEEYGGYELVSISIEMRSQAFSPVAERGLDELLTYTRRNGLVPLLAGGNEGKKSRRLGTRGTYIGALERDGRRWAFSGEAELYAPGVDMICAQPPVEQLGNMPLGVYSGTSLAVAYTAGAILVLCEATGRSAKDVLRALVETRDPETCAIDLDKAYGSL